MKARPLRRRENNPCEDSSMKQVCDMWKMALDKEDEIWKYGSTRRSNTKPDHLNKDVSRWTKGHDKTNHEMNRSDSNDQSLMIHCTF